MDLFEKQAQLHSLFQRSPVDAAYTQGTPAGRRLAGAYSDLDVARAAFVECRGRGARLEPLRCPGEVAQRHGEAIPGPEQRQQQT